MGSTFLISSPIDRYFNCSIGDNLSFNKAELIPVILNLMACPKAANVTIFTDFQWLVNIFDALNNLTINEIEKSKVNYKVL